jgi:hypothetical protein
MSPKTIPKTSKSTSPARAADNGKAQQQSLKCLETHAFPDNRDKDGASDSMNPLLRPIPASTSLTTVRPLFFKNPQTSQISTNIMNPHSSAIPKQDQEEKSDIPTSTDIQHIYAEVEKQLQRMSTRYEVKDARAKRRKTFVEKWNLNLPGQILEVSSSTTGGITTDIEIGEKVEDEIGLVIKEADCGLKEPKPLRITEVQSIMLLCRGRRGIFVLERAETNSA